MLKVHQLYRGRIASECGRTGAGPGRQSQEEADGVTPAGFFCGGIGWSAIYRKDTTTSNSIK
jgi:hypothetical protein